jgi:hypothetical protein
MMRIVMWVGVAGMLVCCVTGCSDNNLPDLAAASGVVTLDGKPLDDARVTFHPIDDAVSFSYGTTNSGGEFKLSTFGMNDGGLVGRHKVTISKAKVDMAESETRVDVEALKRGATYAEAMPGYDEMMGMGIKGGVKKIQQVPDKYSDKDSTEIEAEITLDGPNEFTFNLETD